MTGSGGWPMTVFLTPDGEPFYGGTYFPPEPRHGLPASARCSTRSPSAWREHRGDVDAAAAQLDRARARSRPTVAPGDASRSPTRCSTRRRARSARTFDRGTAASARAPKFPPASTLEFLLRRGRGRARDGRDDARRAWLPAACTTSVGGGFHRYSVDDALARAALREDALRQRAARRRYLHGWQVTGRSAGARSSRRRVEYLLRELALAGRRLRSAQDADTDGVEGLTFTWTRERAACPTGALSQPFERRPLDHPRRRSTRSCARGCSSSATQRPQPRARRQGGRLVERARARGARRGGPRARPRGLGRRGARAARSSCSARSPTATAACSARGATAGEDAGFLEDYANVAHGLLELHVATGELRWLEEARRLALLAVELFADDERGGFFLTPVGRRAARRADEGPRRPPAAVRELDARARAAAARADLRRRRARAAGGVGAPPARAHALTRAPGAFGWALVRARPPPRRRRASSRSSGRSTSRRPRRARRWEPTHGRRRRPVRRRAAARRQDARRRRARASTSASASPAGARDRSLAGSSVPGQLPPCRRREDRPERALAWARARTFATRRSSPRGRRRTRHARSCVPERRCAPARGGLGCARRARIRRIVDLLPGTNGSGSVAAARRRGRPRVAARRAPGHDRSGARRGAARGPARRGSSRGRRGVPRALPSRSPPRCARSERRRGRGRRPLPRRQGPPGLVCATAAAKRGRVRRGRDRRLRAQRGAAWRRSTPSGSTPRRHQRNATTEAGSATAPAR